MSQKAALGTGDPTPCQMLPDMFRDKAFAQNLKLQRDFWGGQASTTHCAPGSRGVSINGQAQDFGMSIASLQRSKIICSNNQRSYPPTVRDHIPAVDTQEARHGQNQAHQAGNTAALPCVGIYPTEGVEVLNPGHSSKLLLDWIGLLESGPGNLGRTSGRGRF